MKKLNTILIISILFLLSNHLKAQDKMVLRSDPKDTLLVKIIEVGTTEIKYRTWPVDNDMPMMTEEKSKILCIVYHNGTITKFSSDEFSNAQNYTEDRKHVIKIDPFALIIDNLSISYEQSLKPGNSAEVGLGIFGVGLNSNTNYDNSGMFLRLGYKFISTPDYYMAGMRYSHILKGRYIRPEIVTKYGKADYTNYYADYNAQTNQTDYYKVISSTSTFGFGFMINGGMQWVFSNRICMDLFVGLGIGNGNQNTVEGSKIMLTPEEYNSSYRQNYDVVGGVAGGFIHNINKVGIMYQMGLKLGYMF